MGKTKPATNILRSIQNDFAAKIQAQKMLAIFDRFGDLLFVRLLTLDAGSLWGMDCDCMKNLFLAPDSKTRCYIGFVSL